MTAPDRKFSLPRLRDIPRALRKERELAFYGDRDFVPTEACTAQHGAKALEDAKCVLERVKRFEELHRTRS